MITLTRTNSGNPAFLQLVRRLDADLAERDGEEHAFYAQFNTVTKLNHVVVAYAASQAVGCGAIKEIAPGVVEIKRMYTAPEYRGQGVASAVLAELEAWARERSYHQARLETGLRQPEAIRLYEKNGYRRIPNYGQYAGVENSVCFEKDL